MNIKKIVAAIIIILFSLSLNYYYLYNYHKTNFYNFELGLSQKFDFNKKQDIFLGVKRICFIMPQFRELENRGLITIASGKEIISFYDKLSVVNLYAYIHIEDKNINPKNTYIFIKEKRILEIIKNTLKHNSNYRFKEIPGPNINFYIIEIEGNKQKIRNIYLNKEGIDFNNYLDRNNMLIDVLEHNKIYTYDNRIILDFDFIKLKNSNQAGDLKGYINKKYILAENIFLYNLIKKYFRENGFNETLKSSEKIIPAYKPTSRYLFAFICFLIVALMFYDIMAERKFYLLLNLTGILIFFFLFRISFVNEMFFSFILTLFYTGFIFYINLYLIDRNKESLLSPYNEYMKMIDAYIMIFFTIFSIVSFSLITKNNIPLIIKFFPYMIAVIFYIIKLYKENKNLLNYILKISDLLYIGFFYLIYKIIYIENFYLYISIILLSYFILFWFYFKYNEKRKSKLDFLIINNLFIFAVYYFIEYKISSF